MLVALSFVLDTGKLAAARCSSVLCEIKQHLHNRKYQALTYKFVLLLLANWEHSH